LQDHYYNVEHDREYLFLAMDYYPRDLASLLKKKALIKDMLPVYLLQILRGLQYLSENRVAHRDIKPHNILIDIASHNAVICDFGSAKQLTQGESNISYICARGYRAPELIFGSIFYSTAVDMWSFGCIVMEMINYIPLFRGRSNIEQMISIMEVLGRPTET
jgi:serine/threonine protein kinase